MRTRSVPCVLLCLLGCSSGNDPVVREPLAMTITFPTSEETYTTNLSDVTVGGTLTGLDLADWFPFGNVAGVLNETNEALVGIRITGTNWQSEVPIPLAVGENRITAYGHFKSGDVSDEIVITRH